MLEGTTVNITDKSGSAGGRRTGMPGSLGSSNSSGPGLGGNKGETYAVDTSNILFILSGAFVGLEKIVQDRLAKGVSIQRQQGDIQLYLYALSLLVSMLLCDLHQMISMSMRKNQSPSTFSCRASRYVHYHILPIVVILMTIIDLVKYGLIPEFVGRLPVVASVNNLSVQDLVRVMTEPKNSLIKQYQGLFKLNQVHVDSI